MNIETFYPQHPLLKKHIEFYYFVKNEDASFKTSYYAFPNINTALNIHKNVDYEIKENLIHVFEAKKNNYLALINGKRQSPMLVAWNGCIDKVTISFNAVGFNQFIKRPLSEVAPEHTQLFTLWNNDEKYIQMLNQFYSTNDNAKRVEYLETFLLSKYDPKSNQDLLEKAIDLLSDFKEVNTVDTVASKLGLSNKTFYRLFYRHVGISPVGYKSNARFRHSLTYKHNKDQLKNLTEIGYESNFYDQSHFIKMYKKLTGSSPALFFKSLEQLTNEKLIFKFKK